MKNDFRYTLDEIPPFLETLILGLQWLVISIPSIIIVGNVLADFHFSNPSQQIIYIQKVFFVTAVTLLVQILLGHKLPLVVGPATVLLVGIVSSQGNSISAVYSAILIGGLFLFLLSITGLFGHIKSLFTSRVVATILLLIAFTLLPTITNLILPSETYALKSLLFVNLLVFMMFLANKYFSGFIKSTLLFWFILIGSFLYYLLFPVDIQVNTANLKNFSLFLKDLNFNLSLDIGIILSFIICFIAVSINDLGSINAVGELLKVKDLGKRITRGISLTGLFNIFSGLLGVIGPINFSLSSGVVVSTGCASRYTLIPAGIGILIISFLPKFIVYMSSIPSVVIGSVLLYTLASQIAAGLTVLSSGKKGFDFESGIIVGMSLMLSIIISFLPTEIVSTFPVLLRPILGNGFVVGVVSVLILEHLIFKKR